MKRLAAAVLLVWFGMALIVVGADSLLPGFTVETYVSGIPDPSCVAMDTETGAIYYGSFGNTYGQLYRVDPSRTLDAVNLQFGRDASSWYPYAATELEYVDGHVYSLLPNSLASVNTETGVSTQIASFFVGISSETGIANRDDTLYMVPGHGAADAINYYELSTGVGGVEVAGIPHRTYGLEYDPVSDRLFFSDASRNLYSVDLDAGAYTLVGSLGSRSHYTHFAIDPQGEFAYSIQGTQVLRLDLASGALEGFVTGLNTHHEAYRDLTFGPSSDGSGWSLYLMQLNSILEVKGFAAPEGSAAASFSLTGLARKLVRKYGIPDATAIGIVAMHGRTRVRLALAIASDYEAFLAALAGYTLSGAPSAGGGGGIEHPIVTTPCTVGDPLFCSFALTNPATGELETDALCTLTLVDEDEQPATVIAYEVVPYDEASGLYQISIDTTGLEAGNYVIYIGCGDLETHAFSVQLVAP